MTLERNEAQKARGGFYTPRDLAEFLSNWAIDIGTTRILEPSAGDGAFLEAAATRIAALGSSAEIVAVELVEGEAQIAASRGRARGSRVEMHVADFFALGRDDLGTFDAVIGNPPWVRYHTFKGDQRHLARSRAAAAGVELSGLASSWAAYVVHALSLLREGGRLGMVVPAELLRVDYAAPVRRHLSERFKSVRLVAFDSQRFVGAQVDAVLLLASNDAPDGLTFERVSSLDTVGTRPVPVEDGQRWVTSSGGSAVLRELEDSGSFLRLGDVGSVDIGIVTGYNDYFVLSDSEVREYEVPTNALTPIITRSDQLRSVVDADSFDKWRLSDRKVWLANIPPEDEAAAGKFLGLGQGLGVPSRYKCRTRTPWFKVPVKTPPDLFLSYMAHLTPRLSQNVLGALSTNLIHGVYLKDPALAGPLAAAWPNVVTALSAEIEGRTYGGGVLKLETKEAERVLIPNLANDRGLTRAQQAAVEAELLSLRTARLGRRRSATSRAA